MKRGDEESSSSQQHQQQAAATVSSLSSPRPRPNNSTPPSTTSTSTIKTTVPQWKEAVAGGCAGAFSRSVMAPVERIKLLKQLQGSVEQTATASTTAATSATNRQVVATLASKETSAWRMAVTVYKEEGLLAFWRGNLPAVLRVSGTAAINFTCMDYYKRVAVAPFFQTILVQRHATAPTVLARRRQLATSFVSGGLAGATSTTLLYPFEFLRTRLALTIIGKTTDNNIKSSGRMTTTIVQIWKSDGIRGFFQGYGIALAGGIFYRMLYLGGYDALKSEVVLRKQHQLQNNNNNNNNVQLSWGERIFCAQTISLTAGTASYPLDSVRRRMMMQAGVPRLQRRYRNSMHCLWTVYRQERIRGFYLGLAPNLVRSVGGALMLVCYDHFRTMLR